MKSKFAFFFFSWMLLGSSALWAVQNRAVSPQNALQDQNQAGASTAVQMEPVMPPGFPLSQDHQAYVEQLLDAWQKSSSQIKRCVVDFQWTDYNTALCDWRDPKSNKLAGCSIYQGEIRFQAPDKASFEATKAWDFAGPPKNPGDDPEYKARSTENAQQKWVCDGNATYQFDFIEKRLTETRIPPEFQGDGLINSPLPFLFGANKQQMLDRFWIKVITPRGVTDEYWLEVYPKKMTDLQNYQKTQIVISRQDFLPRAIHMFTPDYDEVKNPSSRHFEFANRQINGQLQAIQSFLDRFIRPDTPWGWTRVDGNVPETGTADAQNNAGSSDTIRLK